MRNASARLNDELSAVDSLPLAGSSLESDPHVLEPEPVRQWSNILGAQLCPMEIKYGMQR